MVVLVHMARFQRWMLPVTWVMMTINFTMDLPLGPVTGMLSLPITQVMKILFM